MNRLTKKIVMKCVIFFCIFLSIHQISCAQSEATYYFTKDGHECTKELADSYRKTKLVNFSSKGYAFEDYSMEEVLISKGFYVNGDFNFKSGEYEGYYKNGNRKVKGSYLSDVDKNIKAQKVNSWYYWYENDSIRLETLHAWDSTTNTFKSFIVNFWDIGGVKKVFDGNGDYSFTEDSPTSQDSTVRLVFKGMIKDGLFDGIWRGFYPNGTLFCEETYNDKGFIKGISYDHKGKSYVYTRIEIMPDYKGGDGSLMYYMKLNTNYPWEERKKGIQGKVLVKFVVDNTGKVKDPKVIKSVSPALDEEALRVVSELPGFKPAKIRGQPVKVSYVLPVSFRLN